MSRGDGIGYANVCRMFRRQSPRLAGRCNLFQVQVKIYLNAEGGKSR